MNKTENDLVVKNAYIDSTTHSKWYKFGDKDKEEPAPDGIVIHAGKSNDTIAACGRSDESYGTAGSFELFQGDTKVTNISWSCPWGSKVNSWSSSGTDNDYLVQIEGGTRDSGALGTLTVKVAYVGDK
ncbi:hypothetical protein BGZ50_008791 [Haplosporangium sp. Z 11]|nr:hypothetical protein BGZ50_008791 [Haplosporangium sp. Z 11]